MDDGPHSSVLDDSDDRSNGDGGAAPWLSAGPLISALGIWTALHVAAVLVVAPGTRLAAALVADLVASAAVIALVIIAPDHRRALPFVLGLGALLAGVRAGASGVPLTGVDAGVWVIVAGLLLARPAVFTVALVAALPWATGAGYAAMSRWQADRAGALGPVEQWAFGLVVLCGAVAISFAVQRRAESLASERLLLRRAVHEHSVRDRLTSMVNRSGAELIAAPMIDHARRSGQAVNCLYIDVDGLREVNTALGLAGGDAVLRAVAQVVTANVRTTDVVCRWSGDEFVVVGPGTGMSPLELERRVRAALLSDPPVATELWGGRVSIGSATLVPWDSCDLAGLIAKGEKDMLLRRSLRRQGSGRAGPTSAQR